ncbi:DUF6880 family protein [Puniceibacterium sediminis]|uniref:DUF6880 family protein n=1 Tax=Puniceibacterium sediminis TaxID=1608407 RepID=UPI003CCB90AC
MAQATGAGQGSGGSVGHDRNRYRHAARHLAECQSCDAGIEDYGDLPSHGQFLEVLKQKHGRKHGCWHLADS